MDYTIIKYPRTPHIEGSRIQPGDEDLSQRSFSEIAGAVRGPEGGLAVRIADRMPVSERDNCERTCIQ